MIKLNQIVNFNPFKEERRGVPDEFSEEKKTGVVKYINHKNRWFSVEYKHVGVIQRISFNFDEIGKTVHICEA